MKISSEEKMKDLNGENLKIAIILPFFNDELGQELLNNTEETLLENGVKKENLQIHRVPGALEIPFLAKKIALNEEVNVIISLGIIIRGETPHFDYVCKESISGCMQVQLETLIPIVIGILTIEDIEQAKTRTSKDGLNKGAEFAKSAIFMATKI